MKTPHLPNTVAIQKISGNPVSGGANHLVRKLYGNLKARGKCNGCALNCESTKKSVCTMPAQTDILDYRFW